MGNKNLTLAKKTKNDEFYTKIEDIAKEMENYREQFSGKVVYCNCDNPEKSAFWKYFHLNFAELKLKELVSSYYNENSTAYIMRYNGGNDGDIFAGEIARLTGNGDFRSKECLDLLNTADIVVTNPPFSLFREYFAALIKSQKQFLIIGPKNSISCRKIFPLIKDGKAWLGCNGVKSFVQPGGTEKKFGNIGWYTNMEVPKQNKELALHRKYNPNEYLNYDNYDAIHINKISDIPSDYNGVMGVPLSFLDVHCPKQFEIVTLGSSPELFTPTKKYTGLLRYNPDGTTTKKHIACNQCLTLGYDEKPSSIYCRATNSDKYLVIPYTRVLIRKVNQ